MRSFSRKTKPPLATLFLYDFSKRTIKEKRRVLYWLTKQIEYAYQHGNKFSPFFEANLKK